MADGPGISAELRRGWRAGLGSTIAMGTGSSLMLLTGGLFVKPLTETFHWTRGEIGLGAFASVIGALAVPTAGWLSDRLGPRVVAMIGFVALTATFIGLATMQGDIFTYYGWRVFIDVLGAGGTAIVLTRPLAQAFERFRGAALGVGLGLAALIAMVIVPVVQLVIASYGWRAGYAFLATMPGVVGLSAIVFLLPRHVGSKVAREPAPGEGMAMRAVLRDRRFWLMFLAMLSANMCFGGLLGQLPALLGDRGISPLSIGLVMSGLAGAAVIGRLLEGFLMDRLWAPAVALVTLLTPVGGLVILLQPETSLPQAVAAVLLIGLAQGGEASQISFFTARYFGFRAYGAVYGTLAIGITISVATGAAMFGLVFDRTGAYDLALVIAAGGLVVAALSMLCAGFTPRGAVARQVMAEARPAS